jgi:hypothetical protein
VLFAAVLVGVAVLAVVEKNEMRHFLVVNYCLYTRSLESPACIYVSEAEFLPEIADIRDISQSLIRILSWSLTASYYATALFP